MACLCNSGARICRHRSFIWRHRVTNQAPRRPRRARQGDDFTHRHNFSSHADPADKPALLRPRSQTRTSPRWRARCTNHGTPSVTRTPHSPIWTAGVSPRPTSAGYRGTLVFIMNQHAAAAASEPGLIYLRRQASPIEPAKDQHHPGANAAPIYGPPRAPQPAASREKGGAVSTDGSARGHPKSASG